MFCDYIKKSEALERVELERGVLKKSDKELVKQQ